MGAAAWHSWGRTGSDVLDREAIDDATVHQILLSYMYVQVDCASGSGLSEVSWGGCGGGGDWEGECAEGLRLLIMKINVFEGSHRVMLSLKVLWAVGAIGGFTVYGIVLYTG